MTVTQAEVSRNLKVAKIQNKFQRKIKILKGKRGRHSQ